MKKYISPLTAGLTPDNWKEIVDPAKMSLDETMALLKDLKTMEAFGKKVGGFLKEVVKGKIPKGETEYIGTRFIVNLNERSRSGGLDKDKILEEMGEAWCEDRMKPDIEYTEVRLTEITED